MKTRLLASVAAAATVVAVFPTPAHAASALWVQPLGASAVRVDVQADVVDSFLVLGKADTLAATIVSAERVSATVGACTSMGSFGFDVVRCPVSLKRTADGRGAYTLRLVASRGNVSAQARVTRQVLENRATPTPTPSASSTPSATATPSTSASPAPGPGVGPLRWGPYGVQHPQLLGVGKTTTVTANYNLHGEHNADAVVTVRLGAVAPNLKASNATCEAPVRVVTGEARVTCTATVEALSANAPGQASAVEFVTTAKAGAEEATQTANRWVEVN